MGIRVQFEIDLSISENSLGNKELGNTPPWKGTNDLLDDGGAVRFRIPAGTTDRQVAINGLTTVRLLGIKSTQQVSLKKNSTAGESWIIRPLGTGAVDGVFLTTTDSITALYFTNSGSTDAEVTMFIGGTI